MARLADAEMEDRMKGKTCVITGATSGIGKAAAFALAAKGASLVIVRRNTARGERISRELRVKYPSPNRNTGERICPHWTMFVNLPPRFPQSTIGSTF